MNVTDLHQHRFQKARREADRRDSAWFDEHPDRVHHARASRPYEMPDWDADGHKQFPHMIIKALAGRLYRRPAQFNGLVQDDELYLRQVWNHIDFIEAHGRPNDTTFSVPHPARLNMLRRAGILEA